MLAPSFLPHFSSELARCGKRAFLKGGSQGAASLPEPSFREFVSPTSPWKGPFSGYGYDRRAESLCVARRGIVPGTYYFFVEIIQVYYQ